MLATPVTSSAVATRSSASSLKAPACRHALRSRARQTAARRSAQVNSSYQPDFNSGFSWKFGNSGAKVHVNVDGTELMEDMLRDAAKMWMDYAKAAKQARYSSGQSDDAGAASQPEATGSWPLLFDMEEDESLYVITTDVPGLTREDIKIKINQQSRVMTVSGERQRSGALPTGSFSRRERVMGGFKRAITLPRDVDMSAVQAMVNNGVLSITIKKSAPVEDLDTIDIEVN